MKNKNAYLSCQFRDVMKQRRKDIWSLPSSISHESAPDEGEEKWGNPLGSSSEDEPMRHPRSKGMN